jgi:uncharacterized membrane protein
MLVVFPLGLFFTAIAFDLIGMIRANPQWYGMAYWLIAAGILSALVSAVFGWADWFAIPRGTRAKAIGLIHGLGNVLVVVLFAVSWLLRNRGPLSPEALALACSFVGGALTLVTGWLGGELVDRLGVGVDTGAHLNAPSSLSNRPATESAAPYTFGGRFFRGGRPTV